jgi:hypothetical protein
LVGKPNDHTRSIRQNEIIFKIRLDGKKMYNFVGREEVLEFKKMYNFMGREEVLEFNSTRFISTLEK